MKRCILANRDCEALCGVAKLIDWLRSDEPAMSWPRVANPASSLSDFEVATGGIIYRSTEEVSKADREDVRTVQSTELSPSMSPRTGDNGDQELNTAARFTVLHVLHGHITQDNGSKDGDGEGNKGNGQAALTACDDDSDGDVIDDDAVTEDELDRDHLQESALCTA